MKKTNLAGAPKPAPKAALTTTLPDGTLAAVETKPVSGLTKAALNMAHQQHAAQCEAIGQEASKLEGYAEADGWKLDVNVMLWFRPRKGGPELVDSPPGKPGKK